MGEGVIFRLVVARAQRVRVLLALAGLDAASVLVVPSWTQ